MGIVYFILLCLHGTVNFHKNQMCLWKTVIDRSKAELLENLDLHLPYIDQSKFTWVHQLGMYLDQKIYKLPIVDVYPIFLANAFDVDVCVLDQIGSECVIHDFPSRGNNKSKPLYLHRINDDHFNGLKLTSGSEGDFLVNSFAKCSGSETPSISSKKKVNPETSHRFQYSGEFLKSLDSFQTIARATRKALFRNKIWKPKHDRTPVFVTNRRKQPTLSLQRGVPRMRSDKVNKEDIVKPTENTVPVIIGNRKSPSRSKWRGTSQNSSLIQVTQGGTAEDKPGDGHIKVCTVNTQSIRNKTGDVVEHVLSNKIDICAVTETWLKPADDAITQECQRVGYSFTDHLRQSGRVGGGTGLLCRSNLTPSLVRSGENKSFEFSEWLIKCPSHAIRLIVLIGQHTQRNIQSHQRYLMKNLVNICKEWYYQKSPFWLQEILIFMLMTARTRMLQNSKIYCLNLGYNNMWMYQLTEMDIR